MKLAISKKVETSNREFSFQQIDNIFHRIEEVVVQEICDFHKWAAGSNQLISKTDLDIPRAEYKGREVKARLHLIIRRNDKRTTMQHIAFNRQNISK